jgi:uncharacterized protein (TIGR03790 family)
VTGPTLHPLPRPRAKNTFLALGLGLTSALSAVGAPVQHNASEVLLVENSNSPTSLAIGAYYQQKRGITNVVTVQCQDSATGADNETIGLSDYSSLIATPLASYLASHPGINFIVLTKGIPSRIFGTTATGSGSVKTVSEPSLDSYLAATNYAQVRGAKLASLSGSDAVGKAWINRYYNADAPFTHAQYGGYLVTRLDGYTQADAMALVDRALAAEAGITQGPILLDIEPDFELGDPTKAPLAKVSSRVLREGSYSLGNADLLRIGSVLQASGIPCNTDISRTFAGNQVNLLGYFSFGSNDDNFTSAAYESIQFAPGAISDTFVSTSARTLLSTTDGGQSLIADLVAHGVTGVEGYVAEPILEGVSSPTIDLEHYLSGYTLAESFYAGNAYIGWEGVILGDPLCCPYLSANNTLVTPIQATTATRSRGLRTETCSEGALDVKEIGNGAYVAAKKVNLTGMQSFTARVASGNTVFGTIAIHLDSLTGPLIGNLSAPVTGDWQAWTDVTCSITATTGIHTVYLVFPTATASLQWFSFSPNILTKHVVPGMTISLQSMTNGAFVDLYNSGLGLFATSATVGTSQQFQVIDAGNGGVSLKNLTTGDYVVADDGGVFPLSALGTSLGTPERFFEVDLGGNNVCLLSDSDGLYTTVETENDSFLYARALSVSPDETFTVTTY